MKKGVVNGMFMVIAAGITAVGTVVASTGGAWLAGSSAADTKVQVVEEREQNHYLELKGDIEENKMVLEKLEDTQQDILRSQDALLRAFNIENPNGQRN